MNDELLTRLLTPTDGSASRLLLVHGPKGSGKSWWMERAAQCARAAGLTVHRTASRDSTRAAAEAAVAAAHKELACIVVDDIDHLDTQARRQLREALDASGGIAVVSAASSAAFEGALAVRVEPLPTEAIVELLTRRGVAPRAAARCASVAAGNPGLAVSLADGLSDAQRTDGAAVPEMPRLAAEVATELHARLRGLGERTCRALVVAAADEDGNLIAVRKALEQLGEGGASGELGEDTLETMFDSAEEAAVVDVVGSKVTFVDPWLRLAAYHLVAPASRRAAHRALAAAYDSPRQGGARVRHLVAASSGPSDDVAQALIVVAAAAARRGDRAAAARMASQAADLAVANELRSSSLLRAIGWCLDVGEYSQARRLVDELDGVADDEQRAASEVSALLHGDRDAGSDVADPAVPMSEREVATWHGRRRQRVSWWADAEAGRHGRVIQQVGGTQAAPAELWARGVALRHGGFVRDAVELVARTLATLPPGASHVRDRWELLDADLSILAGRHEDVASMVSVSAKGPAWRSIVARATLAASPTLATSSSCVQVPAHEPLRGIRSEQLRGISNADHRILAAAAVAAEALGLPVEAGESWLMAAEAAARGGATGAPELASEYVRKASDVLHRCAVRCWDDRLHSLLAAAHVAPATPVVNVDAELDALSAAEWRVAASVAEGLTNREVAAALFLSVKTVDFHLQQIYRKLALRSRTELAVRVSGHTHIPVRRSAPAPQEHVDE